MITVAAAKCKFVDLMGKNANHFLWGVNCHKNIKDLHLAIKLSLIDISECEDIEISTQTINTVFENYI